MRLSRRSHWFLRAGVGLTLAFIYVPLIVILIYAFNAGKTLEWPPAGLTTDWFGKAIDNSGAREAFETSIKAAVAALIDVMNASRAPELSTALENQSRVRALGGHSSVLPALKA